LKPLYALCWYLSGKNNFLAINTQIQPLGSGENKLFVRRLRHAMLALTLRFVSLTGITCFPTNVFMTTLRGKE
jgi:hypothetical protein